MRVVRETTSIFCFWSDERGRAHRGSTSDYFLFSIFGVTNWLRVLKQHQIVLRAERAKSATASIRDGFSRDFSMGPSTFIR